jgi:amino acid adenylation domain-containing protein
VLKKLVAKLSRSTREKGRERPRAAAAGAVEAVVTAAWVEVLGLDESRCQGDFFELGGHSLVAAQIVARLNEALGIELTLRALFENPTIPALSAAIERLRARPDQDPAAGRIERRPRGQEGYPLSFSQRRLWFMEQWAPGLPTYNMPGLLWLRGALDVSALGRSLGQIVQRQEMLRVVFGTVDGEPFQRLREPQPLVLPLVDLAGLGEPVRRAEARRLAEAEARTPFDLAREVLRVRLLHLGESAHALLVNMHHIVSDGWSMQVFVRELGALYPALSAGRPAPLPELSIQYLDFAEWQREQLRGEALERRLSYWRRQLADVPAGLELPTDRPWPAVQSFHGVRLPVSFPPELSDALRELAGRQRVTLFVALLAGFHALLHRYTGQRDFCVGSPVAGRSHVETERLIGFFVNTLVLRTELDGDLPFSELLARSRETFLGAEANQDVPFELLIDQLRPARNLSRSPFFQALLVLQTDLQQHLSLPGLDLAAEEIESGTAKFEMTLSLADTPAGLTGWWEHSSDLFDTPTIARMAAHLRTLLAAAAAAPGAPLGRLPLLDEHERAQLLVEWNDTARDVPEAPCLHELIEAQARRTPDAPAVRHQGARLTYRELNERANRVAHRLRRLGAAPEARVGVCLERGFDLVVALLGVLKSGAAYVPLDSMYPRDRIAYMLEDSEARILLTQESLLPLLGELDVARVCLDLDRETIAGESAADPEPRAVPGNLSHLIYTSGSTGRPKGVALHHRGAVGLVHAGKETFGDFLSGMLGATSVCFDVSVFEVFTPLCWGGTVLLARDPLDLASMPERDEVKMTCIVPSVASELLRLGDLPASMRAVVLGGEAVPRAVVDQVYRQSSAVAYNGYGPSEDTTYSTWNVVPPHGEQVPIGRPVLCDRAYVLDRELEPVPVGVVGELYLAGRGLARGYLKRPELTAERFVPDPFEPGGRLYHTGDLARLQPSGLLEYLGRTDHQVKIRGFRIELMEIEAVLRRAGGLEEVAVVLGEDGVGEKRLVACLVAPEQRPAADLRAFLRGELPDFMVPAVFVYLDELPRTPSGKVDRAALARLRPGADGAGREREIVAPRTETERTLAAIFARTLGLEKVGVRDNFFELGGHSLLATRAVSRIREELGVELPLRALFESTDLEALARNIDLVLWLREDTGTPVAAGGEDVEEFEI